MPKKVLVAYPPRMLEEIDQVAHDECRTRSDLIREACRQYLERVRTRSRTIGLMKMESQQ